MALAGSAGCVGAQDDTGDIQVPVGDSKADGSTQVDISAGRSVTVSFTASSAKPVDVSVYCGISANPDVIGAEFTVQNAGVGLSTASDPVAGYWQWSGSLSGAQKLKIKGTSGAATCTVSVTSFTASCNSSTSFHSPEANHTHLAVGTIVPTWGDFPAAGNHWGAWAKWNTIYTKPVKRGFYLHNLEHGGVVLSYGCSSPTESAECAEAAANLEALKEASGETRLLITPDPDQPAMYGVRAWRFGMTSDCYDEGRLLDFLSSTIRHGREDVDANPPIPYDPTTLDVDCHDLMAAPDSCN